MAVGYNPRIVTDGLVLALDGANYKSFKGEATTNVVTNTNLDTGWSKTYNTNIQWNDYPPPDNVDSQVVSFVDSDSNGSGYWYSYGDYAPQSPSTTYTISVYARTIGSNWSIRAYTADNSETGRQWTNTVTVPGDGKWYRVVFNSITTPADTQSDSLSFYFSSIPAGQRCWLCAPQMEAKSYATTFTTGTRGTTVATGGGWKDLVGSNSGQLVNGVRESTDGGGSLVFDGTNDYVNIGSGTGINQFSDDFTVSAWVMRLSGEGTWGNIIGDYYTNTVNTTNEWQLAMSSSAAFFLYRVGTGYVISSTSSGYSTSEWINVVVSRIGQKISMYANNNLIATATNSEVFGTATGNLNVGIDGNNSSEPHSGRISNVMIYKNKGLTAEEVQQNFDALRGRFGI